MLLSVLVSLVSFLVTFLSVPALIRKFSNAKIVGKDVHKAGTPEIPEMGGLAVVAGFVAGILVAIGVSTLVTQGFIAGTGDLVFTSLIELLAAIATILILTIIGIFDDLVSMRQSVKAAVPIFAALPLVAIAAGNPYITLPLLGKLYLPIIYPLIFIPIGLTVMSNLTNMFAGFNGMEASLGIVLSIGLLPLAIKSGSIEASVLLVGLAASLLAFLYYNKYPARIFLGDVGTLFIGATIASAAIMGNFEFALVIVMIPYIIDFAIKAKNGFPSTGWWGDLKDDKLYCNKKPVGLAQYVIKKSGGISEKKLVFIFVLIELLFVLLALSFYLF